MATQLSLRKKLVFTVVVTALAAVILGLAGEIYVRRTSEYGYITPEIMRERSLQYTPVVFARHAFPQKELNAYGGVTVQENLTDHINTRGYRGPEFAVPKPAGTTRIIFYGGSQVFDVKNPEGRDWPRRVENILRQHGFPNVEVINAGTPGHASFDSVGRLFAEGHALQPDFVVLCNAWNDLKYFHLDQTLLRHIKPYVENSDPRQFYQNALDRFLCEHSQLFVRLRTNYYSRKLRAGDEGQTLSSGHAPPLDYISPLAVKQYRLNLQTFADIAKNTGSVPVMITQPRIVASNNPPELIRSLKFANYVQMSHAGLVRAFAQTDDLIRQTAQEKGAILLDAAPRLSGRADLFTDEVHFNDAGAQAMAEFVAGELIKALSPK
jgi:lysophospholipase L1-like esterase